VRAFLLAGAARVVASLWPVDDQVTGEFMAAFYPALASGAAPRRRCSRPTGAAASSTRTPSTGLRSRCMAAGKRRLVSNALIRRRPPSRNCR
jgi:hypothetical protein